LQGVKANQVLTVKEGSAPAPAAPPK
jgi:hypothetical protein